MKRFSLILTLLAIFQMGYSQDSDSVDSVNSVDSASQSEQVFFPIADMPKFKYKGCHDPDLLVCFKKYVADNLNIKVSKTCAGTISVNFTIETDGRIDNVNILHQTNECTDYYKTIIKFFKDSPSWKPAKHNGKAVRMDFTIPVELSSE